MGLLSVNLALPGAVPSGGARLGLVGVADHGEQPQALYYAITRSGRKQLASERAQWEKLSRWRQSDESFRLFTHRDVLVGNARLAGLLVFWATRRVLASSLYDITPGDPRVLTVTGAVLALVAAFASWIPARRATRIDPATSLRLE